MKKSVKTIAFLIFWTHIMHEGHMYLYNLLKNQYLQEKTLTFIIFIYIYIYTTKFGHLMNLKSTNKLSS